MTDLKLSAGPFAQLTQDADRLQRLIASGLAGVDDGELFLEYRETESFAFDDGRLNSAAFDTSRGLGLRAVAGEAIGLAHSPELSLAALERAIDAVGAV
jgi:TldD protein